jgi:hypothetical protein
MVAFFRKDELQLIEDHPDELTPVVAGAASESFQTITTDCHLKHPAVHLEPPCLAFVVSGNP